MRAAPALMDRWKSAYAQKTAARTLAEVIVDADVFLGLSAGGVLKPHLLERMAPRPLILALANPYPEIMPEEAEAARPDAMICTGPLGLPEPGQQRPVLPLHLPRRAGCRRDDDQRGHEGRRRQGHRGARPRDALRGRRPRLWRRGASVRPQVAHSEPLRSAPHPAHRAGGGEGRHGERRRHTTARGSARPMRIR